MLERTLGGPHFIDKDLKLQKESDSSKLCNILDDFIFLASGKTPKPWDEIQIEMFDHCSPLGPGCSPLTQMRKALASLSL